MTTSLFLKVLITTVLAAPTHFWVGTSGGFEVDWTEEFIKVTEPKTKKVTFLIGKESQPKSKVDAAPPKQEGDDLEDASATYYTLQSLVGSYASLKSRSIVQMAPEASTEVYLDYSLKKLDHPDESVSLTDLFPAQDIYEALMKDKVVKKLIPKAKGAKKITDLASLVSFLKNKEIPSNDEEANQFPENILTAVSFHHKEGNSVAVRIHLPPTRPKFGKEKSLGILLAVPPQFVDVFKAAETGKSGFLVANAPKGPSKDSFEIRIPPAN